MKGRKTGTLAHNMAVFSAFVEAAGKTLITGMALTPAERQMATLAEGRMRIWAHNVRLFFEGDVVLGLDDLVAEIQMNDPELPLIPERTDQYVFHILKGTVRLEASAIEALLSRYLFAAAPLALGDPKVALDDRGMRLEGELPWGPLRVPIVLAGPVTLNDEGRIQLSVARVEAGGMGIGPLLSLLRTDLERVLRVPPDAPMSARGNALAIDPEQIFPAPRARGRPAAVDVSSGALLLSYDWPEPIAGPPLVEKDAPAFLFCIGHTLLVGKMFLRDAVFQVVPRSADAQVLDFSLQGYRKQLAAGESTLKQHGELVVRLPNLDEIAPSEAARRPKMDRTESAL